MSIEYTTSPKRYTVFTVFRGIVGLGFYSALTYFGLNDWIQIFYGNSEHLDSAIPFSFVIMMLSIIPVLYLILILIKIFSKKSLNGDTQFIKSLFSTDLDNPQE